MRYVLCGINAKYIHSNLAIFCLKSYAKKNGPASADYIIKEYTINHYVEDILQDIYEEKADVIIFSCYIWNISFVRELAAELKKVSPGISIWVGGPEVSYDAEKFLAENPAVNLVMQGEGEQTFTSLVSIWEEKAALTLSLLPTGIAVRKQTGDRNPDAKVYNTGFAVLMDLNEIPFVYEDFQSFEHKIIYYETSRGCPFSCSYCLSSVDKTVRFRSLSLVKPELQKFLDAKIPQVKFVDRTFNCNKNHAMEVWNYIQEHDNGVTNFHFEISSDLLDEDALELFARMRPGLIQLEIGVQSTNPPTIDAIHRHMDLDKVFAYVDKVHALGNIHQHLDLIAGLPYENYEQFRTSFNDLYVHAPDQLQLGFLKVLKGTCMEKEALNHGIKYRSLPPYEVLETKWLTYDEVIRLKGIEELVEMYYNSGQYTCTLQYVIPFFQSPFDFFEAFSESYRRKGCHKINHNRMAKYQILREFLLEQKEKNKNGMKMKYLDQILLLDMYLRENMKSRPKWARELAPYKKQWKQWYREKGDILFQEEWEDGSYDSKKAANQSHIEPFDFDAVQLMKNGKIIEESCLYLFDYGRRNPLNMNARMQKIVEIET